MSEQAVVATKRSGLVTFLLDRTFSMNKIKESTLVGFNGYLTGLQAEESADIYFTLITFDDVSIDTIHAVVPVNEAQVLTEKTYIPRGRTPLIEAAIKTIQQTEAALAERTDDPGVVICIQTDGEENCSSSEYKREDLKKLIAEKERAGWQFNFLGAGIDAYAESLQYGFSVGSTMSYDRTSKSATQTAYAASARTASDFVSGRAASTHYSSQDRKNAGDQFWKGDDSKK